ncbi:MAG: hypothetical protein PHC52_00560 [Syntrophales bacterium]|nr:hypothetical protein [Syntrophales bacterium]
MEIKAKHVAGAGAALAAAGAAVWFFFFRKKTSSTSAPIVKEIAADSGTAASTANTTAVSVAALQANAPPAPQAGDTTAPAATPSTPAPVIVVGAVPPEVPTLANEEEIRNYIVGQDKTADHPDALDKWIKAQVEGLSPDHQIRKWLEA